MTTKTPIVGRLRSAAARGIAITLLLGLAGCIRGGSDGYGLGRGGAFLVDLALSGDPISIQAGRSTVVTAIARYSDSSIREERVAWSVSPAGFATIDAAGRLSGVSPGLAYVKAAAVADISISKMLLVNVTAQRPPPVAIDPARSAPVEARIGWPYTYSLGAINGSGACTWKIAAGALPAGLTLQADTGLVTGAAVGPVGTATFTLQVTDADGAVDVKAVTVHVVLGSGGP